MGIFNLFNKLTKRNKYVILFDSVTNILNLLERRIRMVENLKTGSTILDFEFDQLTKERDKIISIIRSGSISFLGNDFQNHLLDIFNNEEIQKEEILHIRDFLLNEKSKLQAFI